MTAEKIRDGESLRAWLAGRPGSSWQSDASAIATRAALRAFPIWSGAMGNEWARKSDWTALPVLRQLLTSGVARKYPTPEVYAAANASASASAAAANAAAYNASASASASAAAFAAYVGYATAATANAAIRADADAAAYADAAADAAAYADAAANADAMWEQISADALMIQDRADPFLAPLWSTPHPDWFTKIDQNARAIWAAEPAPWSFWLRWWDGILAGKPLDWDLQRDIALIPNEVWKQRPAAVAEAIAKIELDRAIAATPNAETVEVNPATGRFRLVPASDLPVDILDYARRKIRKAVALFDPASDNQYRALGPDLQMLRDAGDDAQNLPVEMFDACASASRRLAIRIRNGECPTAETDPLIHDYQTRIREAGADILARDPKTQEVVSARNAITGNDALIKGAQTLRKATEMLEPVTEGTLTIVLSRDVRLATDPNAEAGDRKDASIRQSGRMLRMAKVIIAVVGGPGAGIIFTAEVLEAISKIQASPIFQTAIQLILRYLGF